MNDSPQDPPSSDSIDISLVIPAFNEEAFLPRLLDSVEVARQRYRHGPERIEVIVADNASTDATPRIAEERGYRVVFIEQRRIASARNGGAAVARGRIIAFADADFQLDPETFNYLETVLQNDRIVGGATGLVMERWSLGIAVAWYLIAPPLWMLGMDGGVWFCRREDFITSGGFDETRMAGEDVVFLTRLKRIGARRRPRQRLVTRFAARRLGIPPALVINSTRKWDKHGDWHLVGDVLRGLFYLAFSRAKIDAYIRRYWYEDRLESEDRDGNGV